jgi:hypothetical protein
MIYSAECLPEARLGYKNQDDTTAAPALTMNGSVSLMELV